MKPGHLALVLFVLPTAALAQIEAQPGLREMREQEREAEERARRAPGRLTRAPRLLHQVAPAYPPAAQAERRDGVVILRLSVDEEGYVSRVEVLESAGVDLDDAAMGAACGFVFEPAEVDDVPAPVQLDFRQVFTLSPVPIETPASAPSSAPPAAAEPDMPNPLVEDDPEQLPVNFVGVVREAGTKRPLAEAEVAVVPEEGDPVLGYSDEKGRFIIRGAPTGTQLVRVSSSNYETYVTTETFAEGEMLQAAYFIPRRSYNKFETVVRDRKPSKEVNRVVLRREEVSQIPGTFGDPLRAIENLPGMARAPILGGQLIVRGASPESTGVYMDGVQIPLLYHFGGLTSVVNAEFLETIDFYPGGFGAQYGRATAGIVDVKSRSLRLDGVRAAAKVDLFDSGFFFASPVTLWGDETPADAPNPRRITFGFAARRSYIDALIPLALALFLPPGAGAITVAPVYWDYQAKVEYRPIAGHTLQLFAFGSDDFLKVVAGGTADGSGFGINSHTQFHRVLGKWNWQISPRMENNFMVYAGVDFNNVGIGGGGLQITQDIRTDNVGMRNELRYHLLDVLGLNFGLDFAMANTHLESDLLRLFGGTGFGGPGGGPGGDDGDASSLFNFTQYPRTVGLGGGFQAAVDAAAEPPATEESVNTNVAPYLEAEFGPFAGLRALAGVRFDYFEYAQGKTRFAPSPRMSLRYEPVPGTTLKASYGVYEQVAQALQLSPTVGNPSLDPERARHYIVGLEQRLTPFLQLTMNAFFNRRDRMVSQSARYSISEGIVDFERYSNDGIGRSYGMDFMLRHQLSKSFFGWISYTLSRSENQPKPGDAWELFTYDQTHILTVVGQYRLPWRLPFREWARAGRLPRSAWWNTGWSILSGDVSVGARWRLVTGNPATFFTAAVNDLDTDEWTATAQRVGRLPTFHQLDIRVDYKMAFDSWLFNIYVDFINVYNRQNPEAISWNYRYSNYSTISILPFLPILGVSAEF